jgi:hypothetical protein
MTTPNFWLLPITALIPLLVGFLWYNDSMGFGKAWLRTINKTEDDMKGSNMLAIFALTYLLGLFLSAAVMFLVIHQMHVNSILADTPGIQDPTSEVSLYLKDFMAKYGTNFRTFKHGVLHGVMSAILVALPVTGITALFERRSFRYVAIHVGYWMLTMGLMGGTLSAYF